MVGKTRTIEDMTRIAISLGLLALAAAAAPGENPLKDRTGLRWELPFKSALARATAENRLLLIKPVAFGTTPDGGW